MADTPFCTTGKIIDCRTGSKAIDKPEHEIVFVGQNIAVSVVVFKLYLYMRPAEQ